MGSGDHARAPRARRVVLNSSNPRYSRAGYLGGKTTKIGFKNTKNTVFSPCEQKHTKNTVQYKRPAERARGGALVRHVTRRMRANPWVTRGRTRTRIAPRAPRVRPTARRLQRPCRGRSHWSRHLQQHWSRQQFKRHLHLSLHLLGGLLESWRAKTQKTQCFPGRCKNTKYRLTT